MKVVERGTVFDAGKAERHEACCAFTSLIRLVDGRLICSFKTGPQKLSPHDRVILMESRDEGRSWRRLFDGFNTTFDGVPGSFTAGYLFEPTPGRLLISLHWVDRSRPERPLSNPVTAGVLPMKYLLAESADGGCSWSPPREVNLAPHAGANPTSEILRLADGRLMLSYESWKEWDEVEGKQSANVRFSSDDGKTWSEPVCMAHDPDGRLYYWDNHVTCQPLSGELLAAFWTHDSANGVDVPIHLARGTPDGRLWETPQSTGVAGQVVAPVCEENLWTLVYVHRQDPPSIRAVQSFDRGRTWATADELFVHQLKDQQQAGMAGRRSEAEYWDDMTRWTFGHPKVLRMPDGQLLVVYYAPAKDPGEKVRAAFQRPAAIPTSIYWARMG